VSSLETNGARIDYLEEGSGAPLVVVHGSWGDRQIWELVRPGLARSFRTIAYSRRGHGESSGGGSLDDDVHDLAALIEHLDAAPAHLAGNSLGATICLRLLASRPELVASVSAHEPPLFGLLAGDPTWEPALEELQRRVGAVLELIAQDRTHEAAERFVEDVALGPGAWAELPPQERQRFIRHAATFAEENADPSMYGIELAALEGVTTPVLLTGAAASPALFEPALERLAATFPRAERHRFPDAGHLPHVTHPDEYLHAVTDFASRIARHHATAVPTAVAP
jgi:pimeloyl-ACP methyl ester carboxylesterase